MCHTDATDDRQAEEQRLRGCLEVSEDLREELEGKLEILREAGSKLVAAWTRDGCIPTTVGLVDALVALKRLV
jgi:hypothetical protein